MHNHTLPKLWFEIKTEFKPVMLDLNSVFLLITLNKFFYIDYFKLYFYINCYVSIHDCFVIISWFTIFFDYYAYDLLCFGLIMFFDLLYFWFIMFSKIYYFFKISELHYIMHLYFFVYELYFIIIRLFFYFAHSFIYVKSSYNNYFY